MPVASISPGTIRNPPPMPKKPDKRAGAKPDGEQPRARFSRLSMDDFGAAGRRAFAASCGDHDHEHRKRGEQLCPSTILPSVEPTNAPAMPAPAKISAQRQSTLPTR